MRDLKKTGQAKKSPRRNRRRKQKQPVDLRRLLHRLLRIGVTCGSVALLVIGGFFLVQLLMASDQFRVAEIRVEGNRRLSAEQVRALSDIMIGVNTFDLDLGLIGRKIAQNPWVGEARVQRIFPRHVVIRVAERTPVAVINLGYLYYLDDRGEVFKVLGASDRLDYPVVTGFAYERARLHDEGYARQLEEIVALVRDLQERSRFNLDQVSEIHRQDNGGLTLVTLEGSVRIKLGRGGHRAKLDRLERIYGQLKKQLPILDYIDLNVDEKVIVRIERSAQRPKADTKGVS